MPVRVAVVLMMAFEEPLLVGMCFRISRPIVCLTASGPRPSRKVNYGAQHPSRPRPIKLWASMVNRSKGQGTLMS